MHRAVEFMKPNLDGATEVLSTASFFGNYTDPLLIILKIFYSFVVVFNNQIKRELGLLMGLELLTT